jgi:mannose-1-phosphate guanylyltransferase
MIIPLIMAGGIGSRFWPLSSKENPKQFLNLIDDDRNMIQLTLDRITNIVDYNQIFVATGKEYAADVKKYLPEIPSENISIEPMRRNTAACIGLASLYIEKKYPEAVMTILPADHVITNNQEFIETLNRAAEIAKAGPNMVTIGIEPSKPETGYGYINYSQQKLKSGFKVNEFTEKPDYKKAVQFLKSGNYLWNSGIFIWKVKTIRNMFKKYMPELDKTLERIKEVLGSPEANNLIKNEFKNLDSISIDYGILEKADNIYVVPGSFGWDDVGSWSSLDNLNQKDINGNIIKGNHIGVKSKDSIIYAQDKMIATVGIKDLIVVESDQAILVCNKNNDQDVKELRKIMADKELNKLL